MAVLLHGIQNCLVGVLRAAGVLPAGVDVITVRVNDMPMEDRRGAAAAGHPAGLIGLHPAVERAGGAEGSALLGTGRTTTSMLSWYRQNHDVHALRHRPGASEMEGREPRRR